MTRGRVYVIVDRSERQRHREVCREEEEEAEEVGDGQRVMKTAR